jgi:vitamin K-dependent gamma-carboxylase
MLSAISKYMNKQVSGALLATYRIGLGIFLFLESIRILKTCKYRFIDEGIALKFDFFYWVNALPQTPMYLLCIALIISSLAIILGIKYRISIFIFTLLYAYFLLLDVSFFNNHYYLIALISFLMSLTNADNAFTYSKLKNKDFSFQKIPKWQIDIIRFQILVVYFYAGITKLDPDWIKMNTVHEFLFHGIEFQNRPFLQNNLIVALVTYGGLIFDLTIGFALFFRKTRKIAFIFSVFFHLTNALILFPKGLYIFPYFMIFTGIIFFDDSLPQKVLYNAFKIKTYEKDFIQPKSYVDRFIPIFLIFYILFQILFPLRHHLIEGHCDWTGEAKNFSWRMKTPFKEIYKTSIIVKNKETGLPYNFSFNLKKEQFQKIVYEPKLIYQIAQYIKKNKPDTIPDKNLIMNVVIIETMNGGSKYPAIDSTINMVDVEYCSFKHNKFITLPYK